MKKKTIQIDFGTAKEVVMIENSHGQYLWIGRGDPPLTCYGTVSHKAQIRKLRDWCDQILQGREAK